MNISPPYSRIGCETDPFPPRHTTLRHRDSPEHRRDQRQTCRSQRNEKPHLFNKRIIFKVAGKCCRYVTAVSYDRRARRAERVGRSFIGIGVRMQLRRSRTFHRTRERGTLTCTSFPSLNLLCLLAASCLFLAAKWCS